MENREIAQAVIDAVGGKENIRSVAHCATRLRLMVTDQDKIDAKTVENIEKVKGAFLTQVNIKLFLVQVQ